MDSSRTELVVGFVSGHGFSRAVSLANSIPPLGAEGLWHGLQPVCLSCRWKPRISIRGARLQACGKSASTRRASAPALRPVAQPFLAVRLWSVGSPLTAFFATFRFPATRLPCLSRVCPPQAGFEGSEVEGPLFFVFSPLPTALHNRWPSAGFRREPVVFFQTMSPPSGT